VLFKLQDSHVQIQNNLQIYDQLAHVLCYVRLAEYVPQSSSLLPWRLSIARLFRKDRNRICNMSLCDDRNPIFRGIVDVAFALCQRPNATPIIGEWTWSILGIDRKALGKNESRTVSCNVIGKR
jgi:hypothetical protein